MNLKQQRHTGVVSIQTAYGSYLDIQQYYGSSATQLKELAKVKKVPLAKNISFKILLQIKLNL